MKAVLGGGLENGLIRQLTLELDPERLATTHDYYRSVQRASDANAFNRAATVLAIADGVLLPEIDWALSMLGTGAPLPTSLGWEPYKGAEMWKESWVAFAEVAFEAGAFSGAPLQRLRAVPQGPDGQDTSDKARAFSVHYLMRLFLQLDAAQKEGALLFLPPGDEEVLSQLVAFVQSSLHRPPADLPDLGSTRRDSDAKSITLLAFQPPDTQSIIPVRQDAAVRKYADRVMQLWEMPDPVERERSAVSAMRDVLRADDLRDNAATVFEVTSWSLKALGWVGVPFVGAIGDARDAIDVAREHERKTHNWLLIRTMMNDISLRDYLKRTDNL